MKLSQEAMIIAPEKLRDYVVNVSSPDGASKARYLGAMGYMQHNWKTLEKDTHTTFVTRRQPWPTI